MLKIRLQRVGRKNDPSFRVVVTESQNGPKSGKALEVVGSYDARHGKPQLKADKIKYWISKGAKVSDTVSNMLVKLKVIEGKTINNLPKMKVVEKPAEPAPTPAPVAEEVAEAPVEETKTETLETPAEETAPAVEEAAAPAEEVPAEASVEEKAE